MKRTKEWWARLTKTERSGLVRLEGLDAWCSGGRSSYLPDDCSECPNCSTPHTGYGLCSLCSKRLHTLLRKANDELFVITAAEIEAAELQWQAVTRPNKFLDAAELEQWAEKYTPCLFAAYKCSDTCEHLDFWE